MGRTRRQPPEQSPERARLLVPRSRAEEIIDRHAEEGRALLADAESVSNGGAWEEWANRFDRWRSLTEEAMRSILSTTEFSDEFSRTVGYIWRRVNQSKTETFRNQRDVTDKGVNKLVSFRERLDYIEGPPGEAAAEAVQLTEYGRSVFVVHGRDEGLRDRVALVLERLDFEAVILSEEPHKGRTLIEKFEAKALSAGFAVAILSPDDYARGPDEEDFPEQPNRARQNVILELGYFMGKLGRSRVAALYKPGTERPTDIHGLGFIPLDDEGAWRYKLGAELAAAGYEVDLGHLK